MATKEHSLYKLVSKDQAEAFAWSFEGPNTEAVLYPFQFPPIRADEVRIQQTYFGLCYTDCHLVNQDWFPKNYPSVPGHEILGHIVQKGEQVTQFQIGNLVGAGFIRDSCGKCKQCILGNDQLCGQVGNEHLIPLPKFGGFATHVQLPAKWAFPIPNTIPQHLAPPLLCAGITVYAPLKRHFGANKTVGILGIGGLGHLAIKFSAALGMKTIAISTSQDKEEEARSYGATDFICTKNQEQMVKANGKFDMILSCANANTVDEFIAYTNLVKSGGDFVMVGIPALTKVELQLPFFALVVRQISFVGSLVGSRQENYEMIEFANKHKIYPTCEQFEFENFKGAYDKLLNGRPKYRCVVKVGNAPETLKQ
ncbi:unnamed protein product [Paramecium sonneborni]|uniref:Enoyl reductase (ER) domain-containing protein n=1 Tax=Paramecium sonneborni TaxID=65129 RepID=A0A8S1N6F4_9CILI|nr:unnamed protein product [Paramecium sonneborni]